MYLYFICNIGTDDIMGRIIRQDNDNRVIKSREDITRLRSLSWRTNDNDRSISPQMLALALALISTTSTIIVITSMKYH
jgi:hypothetical protein